MLRILHSLPRTHKLLLLPVATMVTVLGTHKIMAAFEETDANTGTQKQINLAIALPTSVIDTQAPDPVTRHPVTRQNTQPPHQNSVGQEIPLVELTAQEIVDLSFIDTAQAHELGKNADRSVLQPRSASTAAQSPSTQAPAASRAELDSQALHLALQLFGDQEVDIAGGTSYEDLSVDSLTLDGGGVDLENELVAKEDFVPQWETYTVQKGDTFAVMAERTFGLGYHEVSNLLDNMPDKRVLTRWRIGDNIDFKLDDEGQLIALRVMKNARSGYLIKRNIEQQSFDIADIEKATEATQRLFAGTVNGSFAGSAQATGLSQSDVAELSTLLSKKINFRRDTRRGDHFQVLVESDMIDGNTMDSRILAAQYKGAKTDLTVVRNATDERFYTPDGHSLNPAFNRYPFKGHHRISSPFNLRRHHPITGRISPHRGTDFAMHSGTAVKAPADGRVVKSAYQAGGAGNYLVIRHDNGYKTRYMHLSKQLVKEGDRVSMGEKIALSGNTGRSTGPHLHYEVMVNNRQVDAMRVKLPESKNLSGQALATFKQKSKQLLAKLETHEGAQLAHVSTSKRTDADGS